MEKSTSRKSEILNFSFLLIKQLKIANFQFIAYLKIFAFNANIEVLKN